MRDLLSIVNSQEFKEKVKKENDINSLLLKSKRLQLENERLIRKNNQLELEKKWLLRGE